MTRGEKAEQNFCKGMNCTQSVLFAFDDLIDADDKFLMKIASSFGGGFARLREVCGAFSGICMVAGILKGPDGENGVSKTEHYALIREFAEEFKKENGSYICSNLIAGTEHLSSADASVRTKEYMKKRPCPKLCKSAAELLVRKLGLSEDYPEKSEK